MGVKAVAATLEAADARAAGKGVLLVLKEALLEATTQRVAMMRSGALRLKSKGSLGARAVAGEGRSSWLPPPR